MPSDVGAARRRVRCPPPCCRDGPRGADLCRRPALALPRPDLLRPAGADLHLDGLLRRRPRRLGLGSYTGGGNRLFGSSPIGGLGGVTAGYNYQSGQLLVGGELDAGFGSISSNGSFGTGTSGSGTINGLGTLRARVGYVYDRALFYVTGGYAGTVLNGKVADFGGAPNLVINQGHYLNGFSVGLGLEYAVTTKISVKGEYLFNGFNSAPYFSNTRDGISSGTNISLLRAGVNYHF